MSSHYKILVAAVYEELEDQVNLYLQDGYMLAQPMTVVNGEQLVQVMIKHAMIKHDDEFMKRYGV